MSIEELREICLAMKGVTEDLKWGAHLCFNIGGKMFMITSPDEMPQSVSFKAPAEEFDTLIAREGVSPGKYLGRYGWVDVDDVTRFSRKQWLYYAGKSYELVAAKLPLAVKRKLGI
jgi:predicted DNA-binding protein (MmcQ/YjbR family)